MRRSTPFSPRRRDAMMSPVYGSIHGITSSSHVYRYATPCPSLSPMLNAAEKPWKIGLMVALTVLILDQWLKLEVQQLLHVGTSMKGLPGVFEITLVMNTGMAFSLLQGSSPWLFLMLVTLFTGAVGYYLTRKQYQFDVLELLSLGMLIGGAWGNGLDRMLYGSVVDYIALSFMDFPVFNLADAMISVGGTLLAITCWQNRTGLQKASEA